MSNAEAIQTEAGRLALDLFRKANQAGPDSLSSAEQKVLGWAVRLLERSGPSPVPLGPCTDDLEPLS